MGLHGYPRATIDLDLWIGSTLDNAVRMVTVLRDFGFDLPELEPGLFLNPNSIVRFGTPPLRIEVMTAIDGVTYEACARNGVLFDLADLDNLP